MFDCVAYAHIQDPEGQKLDRTARELRFVCNCKISKEYRLLDEETCKVMKRSAVTFNETNFDLGKIETKTMKQLMVNVKPETSRLEEEPLRDEPQEQEPHYSKRQRRPPDTVSMLIQQ